jgi:putative acetyltransferase
MRPVPAAGFPGASEAPPAGSGRASNLSLGRNEAMIRIVDDSELHVRIADLDDPRIIELLATHAERALAGARCRKGHALDPDGLHRPGIDVIALWRGGRPVAVGALRALSREHGELKSMFVADAARGQGVGRRLLGELVDRARSCGMTRLSLETGRSGYFEAARRLYEQAGFAVCGPFGGLPEHPDSVFMDRVI